MQVWFKRQWIGCCRLRELNRLPGSRQTVYSCGDPDIEDYLQHAVEQNGLQLPHDWKSASKLYITLKKTAGLKI